MKHDFILDEDGDIDVWRLDRGYHNGPECQRCQKVWCHHCMRSRGIDIYTEKCPGGDEGE